MSLGGGINSVNLDLLPLTGFSSRMKVGGGERVCTMPGTYRELYQWGERKRGGKQTQLNNHSLEFFMKASELLFEVCVSRRHFS